jgi:hypothetical protein
MANGGIGETVINVLCAMTGPPETLCEVEARPGRGPWAFSDGVGLQTAMG